VHQHEKEHLTMSTKIIINIEEGLSHQEMDDLRYLLSDAVSEFAVHRTPATLYVDKRYPGDDVYAGEERSKKIAQVQRRIELATKLHACALVLDYEHSLPHCPTPVFDYYRTCDEDDLLAMRAALDFLPASQFGVRKGWNVARIDGSLVILGPDDQRATWLPHLNSWEWDPEHAGAIQ
jgi:hypothetical protein